MLLKNYQDGNIGWPEYQIEYNEMLDKRKIIDKIDKNKLDSACLLCSEPTAEKCHRRLLAEYFQKHIDGLSIRHV